MSDSIKAAKILREKYPDFYKTLTTVHVEYEDIIAHEKHDSHVYVANSCPVILWVFILILSIKQFQLENSWTLDTIDSVFVQLHIL